jgi:hypothetical protein
LDFVSFRK